MKTLYLDMDGVVADFVGGCESIVGYRIDEFGIFYPENEWNEILKHKRLFKDLPLFPKGNLMVDLARRFRDELDWELLFLTAIPHNNDFPWAFYDKIEWAKKYYPDILVHFGPYSQDKQYHCKSGDILVDDRPDNCAQWKEANGIAIRVDYQNYNKALQELEEILEKKLSLRSLKNLKSNVR